MLNDLYKYLREELDPNQIQFVAPRDEEFSKVLKYFITRSVLYSRVLNSWPHLDMHEKMKYAMSIGVFISEKYLFGMTEEKKYEFQDTLTWRFGLNRYDQTKAVYDAMDRLVQETDIV